MIEAARGEASTWRVGNNFDLLRLVAALQVVWFHGTLALGLDVPEPLHRVVTLFPGVPMLFVISGFLVSSSLERDADLGRYARARARRIYPALWASFAFTVGMLAVMGYVTEAFVRSWEFVGWVLLQLSFAVSSPDRLDGLPGGDVNPSLWTISVELSFYVMLPALAAVLRAISPRRQSLVLAACTAASVVLYVLVRNHSEGGERGFTAWFVLTNSLPAYLWLFLIGVMLHRNLDRWWPSLAGRGLLYLVVYIALGTTVLWSGYDVASGRGSDVAAILGLSALGISTLAVAFTGRGWAERLLGGNDLSYGIYLYHFLVIHIVLEVVDGPYGFVDLLAVAALTTALGAGSWFLLERRMKRSRGPSMVRR